jgi:putative aldouronate transport system substrate-binding protein
MDRLPSLNLAGTEVNPNFRLLGTSAFSMGSNGRAETQYVGGVDRYYCIGYNDQLSATLQYVDWLYSEEGVTITNWGIEGESYYVDDNGDKQIIAEFVNQLGSYNATGLSMPGLSGYKDFNSYLSACDEQMRESIALCVKNATADPQILLNYAEEDQLVIDTYAVSCQSYATSQLAKFVIGQRDLSQWDQYINELNTKYHLEEMKTAHEKAYQLALQR